MNFFTKLFGSPQTIIKDPQLGKLRYIESDNGTVWAGFVRENEIHEAFDFFIDTDVKVLKQSSRDVVAHIVDHYQDLKPNIQTYLEKNHSLSDISNFTLLVLHVPEINSHYDAELIYRTASMDFSVIAKGLEVEEIILHDD